MLKMRFLFILQTLLVPSWTLNCLKQTFPKFYFAEMPKYFSYDRVNLEVQTLINLQGTDNLLLVGSYLTKTNYTMENELDATSNITNVEMNGFYFRILDNGEHDNFNILDYCDGILR